MRILELQAENFAKLKVVSIRPASHLVQVTGKNRQGKTSVLNAIWTGLKGVRVAPGMPVAPIRDGEERARLELKLGDERPEVIVTRVFTADGEGGYTHALRVTSGEGTPFKKPQEVLDALLGTIAFDPLSWARMDDEAKLAAMRPLVPAVDFDGMKAANAEDYEARTTANRKAKDARARAAGITLPPGAVPPTVDVSALEEELAGSAQFNADVEGRKANRAAALRQVEEREAEIERMRALIAEHEEWIGATMARLNDAPPLPDLKDILAIRAKLQEARTGNEVAAKAAARHVLIQEANEAEGESERLTASIDTRDAEMAAAVGQAVGSVPGLAYAAERLTLNGQPFTMASDAEQLEASILIAGLLNPTLRVIRVRDGSLLDEDALDALAEMAERLDLQVWVERVDSSGAVGFVMEDGELKGPGTATAARVALQDVPPADDGEAI